MDTKMIATSKWLAWVLRHGSAELGLQRRPGGWLKIAELESVGRASEAEIISILQHDSVGRFNAFCLRGTFWIRADPTRRRKSPATQAVVVPLENPPQQQELYPADPPQIVLGGGHARPMMMALPHRGGNNPSSSTYGPWRPSLRPLSPWSGSFIGMW